jgi:hypothetical protein
MTDLSKTGDTLGCPAFVPGDRTYLHNQRIGKVPWVIGASSISGASLSLVRKHPASGTVRLACSTDMTLPATGMSFPSTEPAVRARLFRFLLAPMRGTVHAGTLFTWRRSVS